MQDLLNTADWTKIDKFPGLDRKLRILACPPNEGGCAYYRTINPYEKIQELFPNTVEVRFDKNPLGLDLRKRRWDPEFEWENMKWADIVHTSNISNFGGWYTARIVGKAKEFGKITHFDTDDLLTNLYEGHRLRDVYENQGLSDTTKFIYLHSDIVTVTQHKFADRIREFVGECMLAVVQNVIDYNLPSWNAELIKPAKSKYCRFGWAGGIHHLEDVKEFAGVPHMVNQRLGRENCRWDFYGRPPVPKDEAERQKEKWQQDTWEFYTNTFTRGFKGAKNWQVIGALPTHEYGRFYTNMDVAIAPLQMNDFNDSKSSIKVAEAGRYRVPLVASDVGCYEDWIINGETGFLVPPDAPKSEWVKILTRIGKDKKLRQRLGNNLHDVTERHFNINTPKVAAQRLEIYKQYYEWQRTKV